jgi:chromosome segregation ATPase
MSSSGKGKGGVPVSEKTADEGPSLDAILSALEERVDVLSTRVRDLTSENARLKGAVIETAAERDRLKGELGEQAAHAAKHGDMAATILRHEAEREGIRQRIERLVKALEDTAPRENEA